MLGVERLHVMIKKLAKSAKNIMVSIQKNNDRLIQSQLQWRYDPSHKWATKGRQSNFMNKQPIPQMNGDAQPRGGLRMIKVSKTLFKYLQDEWTIKSKPFDKFRDKYYTYVRRCKREKTQPVPLAQWQYDRNKANSEEEQRYYNNLYVVGRSFIVLYTLHLCNV